MTTFESIGKESRDWVSVLGVESMAGGVPVVVELVASSPERVNP